MSTTIIDEGMPPALFGEDFTDTPRARRSDPITSHEAADSTQDKVAASRAFVLYLLRETGPVADHELVAAAQDLYVRLPEVQKFSPSRLRTARHELAEEDKVIETGYYHLTESGRRAVVWEVAA